MKTYHKFRNQLRWLPTGERQWSRHLCVVSADDPRMHRQTLLRAVKTGARYSERAAIHVYDGTCEIATVTSWTQAEKAMLEHAGGAA